MAPGPMVYCRHTRAARTCGYEPMPNVLTINGGSSSIRFAVFEAGQTPRRLLRGKMDRIGGADTYLSVEPKPDDAPTHIQAAAGNHGTAVDFLADWLESQPLFKTIEGVGHRVV